MPAKEIEKKATKSVKQSETKTEKTAKNAPIKSKESANDDWDKKEKSFFSSLNFLNTNYIFNKSSIQS